MKSMLSHPMILFLLVTLALTTASAWGETLQSDGIQWHVDLAETWKSTREIGRPMLLFVTVEKCAYCAKMKNGTYNDESVVSAVKDTFVPAQVDGRHFEELVDRLEICIYPTTVIISPDHEVLDRVNGYVSAKVLQARLATVLSHSRDKLR